MFIFLFLFIAAVSAILYRLFKPFESAFRLLFLIVLIPAIISTVVAACEDLIVA